MRFPASLLPLFSPLDFFGQYEMLEVAEIESRLRWTAVGLVRPHDVVGVNFAECSRFQLSLLTVAQEVCDFEGADRLLRDRNGFLLALAHCLEAGLGREALELEELPSFQVDFLLRLRQE